MSDRSSVELSIVIPVYCEAANLEELLNTLHDCLQSLDFRYEVVLVDDGSPDETWSVIERLGGSMRNLEAVRLSRNFGKEAALSAGLDRARGRAVVVMDGDLQHPPSLIPEMVSRWRAGDVDVVEAVKKWRGKETVLAAIGARVFYGLFRVLTGHDLRGASDFKLLDRRVVDAWRQMPERVLFFRGMTTWLGFRRAQIDFHVDDRARGRSGWTALRLTGLARSAITAFSSAPLQIITFLGIGFGLFSVLLGVQALYYKLTGAAVTGFTTVILLLLIIGSALMIGLGIIGEYLARIYDEVKGRPRYIVSATLTDR